METRDGHTVVLGAFDQLTSHGWVVHDHAEEVLTKKLANGG